MRLVFMVTGFMVLLAVFAWALDAAITAMFG